ncbi:MAG: aminotransferase class V-fold PLP-dependent enzyme [Mycobacteriales bacterium]
MPGPGPHRPLIDVRQGAAELDAADPLRACRALFIQHPDVVAYLDGNSLGRPLVATRDRMRRFVDEAWAGRLIRAWDEEWMDFPTQVGDTIGRVVLGAAPGQTVVADSTTVVLYKLARAAVAARPGRREVVVDEENFPTDRFVVEGMAAELGLTVRRISPDQFGGVTEDQVRGAVGAQTALVLLSHVAYKSGYIADMPAITAAVHEGGALVLWDVSHSVGAIDVQLDAADADLAVGCTYKYLNGGPGSPAFGYVAQRLHGLARQPIQGWMGAADPFGMTDSYEPARGIRQFISGTPPILGMLPMLDMLELIDRVGIAQIRRKSLLLTQFVFDYCGAHLAPLGVTVATPREDGFRGGHVTLEHPNAREMTAQLWKQGVIPDFRPPSGMRIGLSPLSTSFAELGDGLEAIRGLCES